MPALPVGFSDDRLMALVHFSVAQSTWSSHSKAWGEWLALTGEWRVEVMDSVHMEVTTTEYLLRLREAGVSAAVALRCLVGVSF